VVKYSMPISSLIDVNRACHVCGTLLPPSLREEFCPVCTLQGALVAHLDREDGSSFLGRISEREPIEEIACGD
jgi:hypothetical protein